MACECLLLPKRTVRYRERERSWLIRVMRLIRCTIGPRINHEARINHAILEFIAQVCESTA